jgi:alpha-tubulin suppressor-like RCC1 family protein
VHAWGSNSHGQLGDGSTLDRTAPVGASGLTDAVAVAAGAAHSYALRSDGRVSAWGRGDAGQLGHGGTTDRLTPATIPSLSGVVAIASGANHGLALLSDGTLKAWGDNQRGQLGDGTQDNGLSPVAVIGLDNLTAVAAGSGHSLAVQGDGTVWAWGRNDGGQLGDGTTTDSAVPVRVIGLDDVRAVAAGGMTSVALRADGSVWVWGGGSAKIPVRVEGFGGAVAIAAGLDHRLALKADRTVWAWGANDFGQLGDGSGANQPTPVPVTGLATTAAIAAGSRHSLAVTAPLPSLSVSDVSISEGNTGAASVAFNVTLSAARPQPVTVRFLTADGPAPAGARAGSDYQATSGTLVFPPGTTTQTVVVPVYGDTLAESDETFSLNLLSPRGAALAEAQGIATVVDNDAPGLSIEDLSVIEGNSGTKTVSANVRLSAPSTHTVTVSFQTTNGTATAGSDYVDDIGTLTFDPGVVGVAINLRVLGDAAVEPNETFFVRLSNPMGAVLENTQATVTVVNDDTATAGQAIGLIADDDPTPLLAIDDAVVSEGETAQFTVKLVRANGHPAPSSQPVTVHYATADGTARAGTDYQPAFGTLNFAPGVTSQTVGVVVNTDATAEGEEIFFVNLTSPTGAVVGDGQGIGTVRP